MTAQWVGANVTCVASAPGGVRRVSSRVSARTLVIGLHGDTDGAEEAPQRRGGADLEDARSMRRSASMLSPPAHRAADLADQAIDDRVRIRASESRR